jgi:hydroxyacylglutathione hydrolase
VAVFLIEDETGGRWMVDAGDGSAESASALAAAGRGLRRSGANIRGLVLTHAHRDHAGGLDALRPSVVIAHAAAVEALRADDRWPSSSPLETVHGEHGRLARIPGWDWILARGHAPGHLMLWHRGTATLLAGDQFLLGLKTPLRVADPDEDSLGGYLNTAGRAAALEPRVILPSHTEAIFEPVTWLERTVERLRRQVERTRGALTEEPTVAEEILARTYRSIPDSGARELLLREQVACLRHLAFTGGARRDFEDGRERFRSL